MLVGGAEDFARQVRKLLLQAGDQLVVQCEIHSVLRIKCNGTSLKAIRASALAS